MYGGVGVRGFTVAEGISSRTLLNTVFYYVLRYRVLSYWD